MKKPLILLITLLMLLSYESYGQYQNKNFVSDITNFFNENGIKEEINTYENVKGSPYVEAEFKRANISLKPELLFYVKYNAFTDHMEVKSKNENTFALNKSIDNITVAFIDEDKVYHSFFYDKKGETLNRFFNVLNPNSKTLLLKKEEIVLKEKVVSKSPPYVKDKPARFVKSPDRYYVKFLDRVNASELPKKKKDFAKLFPKLEKEVLNFIKSEKIKFSKEADLIKLFNEVNRLKA